MPVVSLRTTYLGIELLAKAGRSQRSFCYVALDGNLKLIAIGTGDLDETLAYTGGQTEAFVAINAPRQPNLGLMRQDAYRQKLDPPPAAASWQDYRVVEYLLRQHHIPVLNTSAQKDRCPPWVQSGFELYNQLEKLGFCVYSENQELRQTLEVHPLTVFSALLGQAPFGRESLEGRLQRQLILNQKGIEVADPMRFFEEVTAFKLLRGVLPLEGIFSPGELDAFAGAYTAWAAANRPDEITLLGDAEEGQIVVPVKSFKEHY